MPGLADRRWSRPAPLWHSSGMKTRKLGFTDLELTTVGLGTWAIGGPGWAYAWGAQDDRDSVDTIHRALDLGINWIDTAAVYGFGHSEEIVGRAVKGRRDAVILATKCGRVWDPGNPQPFGRLTAKSVREELEASLARLGTDHIDLYQVHWPDPEAEIEEGWGEISRAVARGDVRYAGASNFSVAQLRRVQAIHPVASLQPPYSMLRREVEKEILGFCAAKSIGIVAYSPMQAGLLTGAFTRERAAALPDDDWRKRNPMFTEPELSRNLALVERLRAMAARHGRSPAELAIAWVLRRPEVTSAIVGGRRPSQVAETLGAADWALSTTEIAEIEGYLVAR
jgi:aryl-alcohol dehydrogenase-like predicted oxidoreductase